MLAARMCRALRQQDAAAADPSEDIGRLFLYHSSRKTVLKPGTNCLAVFRTTAPG